MIIKVCGMRDANNIQALDEIKSFDWMGFIFYPKSPRYVSEPPSYLPKEKTRVGVFVNESIDNIIQQAKTFGLNAIQLHGKESSSFCQELRAEVGKEMKIIKMIAITTEADLDMAKAYEDQVDYLLFETKCSEYGGSGKSFDWEILHHYHGTKPFLITGGIQPSDAEKVKAFSHPMFAGVDLNSGFETAPGMKDPILVKDFIQEIKK